jgi:hypothetical protein
MRLGHCILLLSIVLHPFYCVFAAFCSEVRLGEL